VVDIDQREQLAQPEEAGDVVAANKVGASIATPPRSNRCRADR
jgi:hypothetical protein